MSKQTTFKNYLNRLLPILDMMDTYITNYNIKDPTISMSLNEAYTKWNTAVESKSIMDYVRAFSYCALSIGLFYDKFKYAGDRKESLILLDELKIVVTSYILFERTYIVYKESPDKNSPAMKELFKAITNYFETIDIIPPSASNPTLN